MSSVHCVVVWEFQSGGHWVPHTPGVTRTLERAHAKKLTRVVLADADPALKGHYVNLRTLTQSRDMPDGGTAECDVRRSCYSVQSVGGRGARWEWARLSSPPLPAELHYEPMPMEVQCVLEDTWLGGGECVQWEGWLMALSSGLARRACARGCGRGRGRGRAAAPRQHGVAAAARAAAAVRRTLAHTRHIHIRVGRARSGAPGAGRALLRGGVPAALPAARRRARPTDAVAAARVLVARRVVLRARVTHDGARVRGAVARARRSPARLAAPLPAAGRARAPAARPVRASPHPAAADPLSEPARTQRITTG